MITIHGSNISPFVRKTLICLTEKGVDKVLNAKCTTCHTLERWNELGRTSAEGREALLMRMRKLGAEFSDEDLKILKHLVKD